MYSSFRKKLAVPDLHHPSFFIGLLLKVGREGGKGEWLPHCTQGGRAGRQGRAKAELGMLLACRRGHLPRLHAEMHGAAKMLSW